MNSTDILILETLILKDVQETERLLHHLAALGAPPSLIIQLVCARHSADERHKTREADVTNQLITWAQTRWNVPQEEAVRILTGESSPAS